jgi:hypothetical protein
MTLHVEANDLGNGAARFTAAGVDPMTLVTAAADADADADDDDGPPTRPSTAPSALTSALTSELTVVVRVASVNDAPTVALLDPAWPGTIQVKKTQIKKHCRFLFNL